MKLIVVVNLICLIGAQKEHKYLPLWSDLDGRPLPQWYDSAKIGIMLHWGVFSVPAYGPPKATNSEWILKYWRNGNQQIQYYMDTHYSTGVQYKDLARNFTAKYFNPNEWVDLFQKAGARYIILSAKHLDGYLLFPPEDHSNNWNSVKIGPHRDLVGELSKAVRAKGLQFGVYYALHEWYNKNYLDDKKNYFRAHEYVKTKVQVELRQLAIHYKPTVIWSDSDWYNSPDYWNSTNFLAWLYNYSPQKDNVVVNDRWGQGTRGQHGDFFNIRDRYNPRVLQKHKWENSFSLDKHSRGYRKNIGADLMTIEELIENIVSTVSCGGNALINFGPTSEGIIPEEFKNLLVGLGDWLNVNGEAIYDTSPWLYQNEFNRKVWFTCKSSKYDGKHPIAIPWQPDIIATYAIFFEWPESGILKLESIKSLVHSHDYYIELLGHKKFLEWRINNEFVEIRLPDKSQIQSKYAWTLKLTEKIKAIL